MTEFSSYSKVLLIFICFVMISRSAYYYALLNCTNNHSHTTSTFISHSSESANYKFFIFYVYVVMFIYPRSPMAIFLCIFDIRMSYVLKGKKKGYILWPNTFRYQPYKQTNNNNTLLPSTHTLIK